MEQRADYYKNQLASALNMEVDQIDAIIAGNGDLRSSIEQIIEAKTQDRAVSAYLDEYQQACENVVVAEEAVKVAREDNAAAIERQKQTQADYDKAYQDYMAHLGQGLEVEAEYKKRLDDATAANSYAKDAVNLTTDEVIEAEYQLDHINNTMASYEGYMSALASGEVNKINEALKQLQKDFITAENGTKESLQRQYVHMKNHYDDLVEAQRAGDKTVTDEMIKEAKGWVDAAETELNKLGDTGENAMNSLKGGINKGSGGVLNAVQGIADKIPGMFRGILDGVNMGTPTATLHTYAYSVSGEKVIPYRGNAIMLAQGAVIPPNKEFLAVLGDQKHGTNVEAPLSTIQDAVRSVMKENSSDISPEVVQLLQRLITVVESKNVSISKRDVASAAIDGINDITKRTGRTPILG